MLILTRRAGETIKIGDEVTVSVLEMKGGQIKFGINAPPEIAVHREEIYQRIAEQTNDTIEPPQASRTEPSAPTITYKKSRS